MPPYMAAPHYHLSRLPVSTKIALTCFSLLVLFGLGFVVLRLFPERTRFTSEGAKDNFGGNEWRQERGEIVEQERARPTERQIYDIIHPHSFLMAVIYFILCHLMEMSRAPKFVKIALYLIAFLSLVAVMLAPLLIWNRLSWAPLAGPAVAVMTGSFAIMTVLPVLQMWFGRRDANGS